MELDLTEDDEKMVEAFARSCQALGLSLPQIIAVFKLTRPIALSFGNAVIRQWTAALDQIGEHIGQTEDPWTAGYMAGLLTAQKLADQGVDKVLATVIGTDFIPQLRATSLARITEEEGATP